MKSSEGLHLKTFTMIFLMVVFGPLGDVLLSRGMRQIGAVADWSPAAMLVLFTRTFTSPMIWAGILSLLAFFVSYMLVLSWADYSFVQPASAMSYAVVALLGFLLLGEHVSALRWAGILTLGLGVLLVGHTPPRTTE